MKKKIHIKYPTAIIQRKSNYSTVETSRSQYKKEYSVSINLFSSAYKKHSFLQSFSIHKIIIIFWMATQKYYDYTFNL